ncbi:hypothetical protein P9B03_08530 [Metasolibacillus meyeri]|uniref:Uncharacterized protein n=1 Tax=Metasolibacillus meyeri TaxID=1071052 RepID=A0AAW9NT89_9BACL|nr:hypothetical protein [Metasolibacillus meyeri]MEC1178524.1 hypothetical protein [Metasolibacillus meyeri]
MKGKRISETERIQLKKQLGINSSDGNNKKCNNCFYYTKQKICSKHLLVTKREEVCAQYASRSIKVFQGGSASSK